MIIECDKYNVRLNELFEQIGPNVLYHYTISAQNALSILQGNYFRLNAYFGTAYSKEDFDKRFYYLSATRSKVGDYHVRSPRGVMFVLDRDKIQNNLHIKPLDYWRQRHMGKSEAEDRIVSDQPRIENARKYILEIHIGIEMTKSFNVSAHNYKFVKTYLLARQFGIPAFFYDNMKDWQAQAKSRAITPNVKELFNQERDERLARAKNPMPQFPRTNWLAPWLELHHKNKKEDLSERGQKLLYELQYGWYTDDLHKRLAHDIHNEKRNPTPTLHKLIAAFRKLGIRQPKEYMEKMKTKWSPKD